MKSYFILIGLALLSCGYSVVILKSSPTTKVVDPAGAVSQYSPYYNKLYGNVAGADIQWIVSSKFAYTVTYQQLFYSSCTGKANLTISAANEYHIYLDGVYIGGGFNHTKTFFQIKLTCGSHNFTVGVYTKIPNDEGLTFAINQDQSNCYNCQATAFWNQYTCACQCLTSKCQCAPPKIWKDYPSCGCVCPPVRLLADAVKATTNQTNGSSAAPSNSTTKTEQIATVPAGPASPPTAPPLAAADTVIRTACLSPKYYDQNRCGCICHVSYCPPNQTFDVVSCTCKKNTH